MTQEYVPAGLDPEVAAQFAAARAAVYRTCYAEADTLLQVALARAPDHPLLVAYAALLARVLYRDSAPLAGRARELLRRSESVDDDLPEALVGWAVRDLVTAEERLRAFVARVPRDPFARHLLGATQLARGSVQEAVGTLESLISDDSDFTPALNHLGAAYLALGEVDRGLATLRHFVERDPGNASARDSLAGALEQAGDREAAIGQLTRALLLDPSFAYAWLHLGEILEQLGETDLAARAYRTARDAPGAYGAAFVDVAEKNLARLGRDGDPQ